MEGRAHCLVILSKENFARPHPRSFLVHEYNWIYRCYRAMMCHATKSSVVKEEGNEKRLLGKHGFNRYQISFFPLVTVYLLINLLINSTITAGGYADGKFSAGFKKHDPDQFI